MTLKRKVFIGILSVFILGLVWIGIEIFISYQCLTIEEYTVQSEKITKKMKVLLISDLHNSEFGRKNQRLVKKIKEQEPDLILLAGDILNEDGADSHIAVNLVRQLSKTAPVCYSLGNHEEGYLERKTSDLLTELKEAGADVLDQEFKDFRIQGNSLRIGGLYDYAFGLDGAVKKEWMDLEVYRFLTEFQSTDSFTLMMAHRPDSFIWGEAAKHWAIDLVVSGHNHGGQVILPWKGGLYGGDQGWFPKYADGIHHFEAVKNMIITRGLGSSREKLPRFHNIPEIVVIHLEKKS